MKPLVTTVRAALSCHWAVPRRSDSAVLFKFSTPDVDFLLAAHDDEGVQRIIMMREQNVKDPYVPQHLVPIRRDVLSRIASFAERARTPGSLFLPRQWHQYKYHNYMAFFVAAKHDIHTSRWITEISPGDRTDIIFWKTTTSADRWDLEVFAKSSRSAIPKLEGGWAQAIVAATQHFAQVRSEPPDVEMSLPALEQSATKGWTYEQWLGAISNDQRAFIEASTDKSIRLRGPAGSGKTLALTLKAIREVLTLAKPDATYAFSS